MLGNISARRRAWAAILVVQQHSKPGVYPRSKPHCRVCGAPLWVRYHRHRTVVTLPGNCRLTRGVRHCSHDVCPEASQSIRPETVLYRNEALVTVHLADGERLRDHLADHVVAIDGLQPDVGHEVL